MMAKVSQFIDTAGPVYVRAFRYNQSSGNREVWNVATSAWESYSAGSIADYGTAAVQEGTTKNWVVDLSTSVAPDREVRWLEWYVQSGGAQAESDAQAASYSAIFDAVINQFVAPTMVVGTAPGQLPVDVKAVGGKSVLDPSDVGGRLSSNSRGFAHGVLPSGVTQSSSGEYSFDSTDDYKLLRASQVVDPTKSSAVDFQLTQGSADVWVGYCKPATDYDDVQSEVIQPGTSGTEDQFYAGFILRTSGNAYSIGSIGGSYATYDQGAVIQPHAKFRLRLDVEGGFLRLFKVSNGAETEVASILAVLFSDFTAAVDAAFGVTMNVTATMLMGSIDGYGVGYAGANDIPTAVETRQEVDSNSTQLSGLGTLLAGVSTQVANVSDAVDEVPTNTELAARTLLAADYFDPAADAVANVTLVATTTDLTNGGGGGTVVETRDLEPPQFAWTLRPRSDGAAYSPYPLRIVPGETIVAGFDCKLDMLLPEGVVLATMSDDPLTLSPDPSPNLTALKVGIGGRYANSKVSASPTAVVGTEAWLEMDVTNSRGDGPFKLAGRILVVAKHP